MQSQVISNPQFKHWVYTVIGLFIATAFLVGAVSVANYVDTLKVSRIIVKWFILVWNRIWGRMEHLFVNWKQRWKKRDGDSSSDETELENRGGNGGNTANGEV
jgi:hypothetical protein